VILIPYSILFYQSDFVLSIIPGWNTTINSFNLIATIFKLTILLVVLILYWKLTKLEEEMKVKIFISHLFLTIPSIFISKFSLSNFINYDSNNVEKFITEIENINRLVIIINLLFVIGQILFGIYYYKILKRTKLV
jgi:hypothetical protein